MSMLRHVQGMEENRIPKSVLYSGVPRNFFGGGAQQIQLRIEGRENGDLGMVAP
jgi:hypothetical protein